MPRARVPTGMVARTVFLAASITETEWPRSLLTYTSGVDDRAAGPPAAAGMAETTAATAIAADDDLNILRSVTRSVDGSFRICVVEGLDEREVFVEIERNAFVPVEVERSQRFRCRR